MRIMLFGYGKMGKTIERIANSRGHLVPYKIDVDNQDQVKEVKWNELDLAIEFTQPDSAIRNIELALSNQVPVLSGTTGWLDNWSRVEEICRSTDGTFFYASNFSIGVNLFFQINRIMAGLMGIYQDQYDVAIEEVHHTQKKDAPSGTAITLAEGIIQNFDRKKQWLNAASKSDQDLVITSKREGMVPGTHTVTYSSAIDDLEIKHTAHGREGFASGVVAVAEWLKNKKGILSMDDYMRDRLGQNWTHYNPGASAS